jgi:hypothetical protein
MREAIEMACEAGFMLVAERDPETGGWWECFDDEIKRLEALVRADEREQAEERVTDLFADMETPYLPDIIKAIRARGEASKRGETK